MHTPSIDDSNDVAWSYHLYCHQCGNDWWSQEAFPVKCPACGKDPYMPPKEDKEEK